MAERVPGVRVLVALAIVALALRILQLLALPFRLEQVFIVLFTAVLIAAAVAPAASVLERRRVPRGVTVLLVYLAALLILGLVVALIVPLISNEVNLLRERFPEYNQRLKDIVARFAPDQANRLSQRNVVEEGANRIGGFLTRAPGFALTFSGMLVRIVIVLVMGYFMAVEEDFAERVMRRFTPPRHRARVSRILGTTGNQLGHWARAQILLALSFGAAFGVGLWLLRVPYAVTLGVIGGILEIIPYVGGFITVILAVLIASTKGVIAIGAVLVWYTIVVQAEAHILAPKLMERALGLHPLVVITALFIGAESLGIFGALLAVPIAVVLQVLLDEFYAFDDPRDDADGGDPSPRVAVPVQPGAGVPADGVAGRQA